MKRRNVLTYKMFKLVWFKMLPSMLLLLCLLLKLLLFCRHVKCFRCEAGISSDHQAKEGYDQIVNFINVLDIKVCF